MAARPKINSNDRKMILVYFFMRIQMNNDVSLDFKLVESPKSYTKQQGDTVQLSNQPRDSANILNSVSSNINS